MSTHATHGHVPPLTLGWRLKMALGDIKVQDMADKLGVNRATVGRWMADKGAPPKRAYLLQWAMITGTDAGWLEHGILPGAPDPGDSQPNGDTVLYPAPFGLPLMQVA